MVSVKILGTGCTKCKNLDKKVREIVVANNLNADVTYINDINEMIDAGIMMTPGLVINGVVKSFGIIPKETQIIGWINDCAQ